ncbi:MAG: DUF255 domain-containing protein [Candidatus Latescibacteria bacterium]|nr:DUF255 domain-containing protein [bacterium]MBD3423457.1 DUF255 domain-containing protein [Candidatus Latescibacterota bacterium]
MDEKEKKNRLANESSPYLLQHSENPVDWYPWGEEAFDEARRRDRPIFLSIGYSTCHWCHVMADESFRDPEVAELMNRAFVSIKVDREERPDIDDIYMTVCQMITGTGGWPLNIIMTPDRKPFYAATYIPREDRFGRVGMLTLIPRVSGMWENSREELAVSSERIIKALKENLESESGDMPGEELLREAYRQISGEFDQDYGGFGTAPKFPSAHKLKFLLRYWNRSGEQHALEMVEKTLMAMRRGGVFDQIGFGFHRYSTDRSWILPHFEKMLYDQATLLAAYTDAYLITGKQEFRETAGELITYLVRDMRSPEGAFYSAEDADSEGKEGSFYLWSIDQLNEILTEREAALATRYFNLEEEGNFRDQATGRKTGENILHVTESVEEVAESLDMKKEELERLLASITEKLFLARSGRVRPGRDDKVLADWNGMVIEALAAAGAAFGEREYTMAAADAADFVIGNLEDEHGRLLHRFRGDRAGIPGLIDDYAFMISGLIELYQADFNLSYLEKAVDYMNTALKQFWDSSRGGFYTSPDFQENLIIRKKQSYDGAVPSGNSAMLLNLLRLSRLTGDSLYEEKAEDLARAFSSPAGRAPSGYTGYLSGIDFALGPSCEIVITGEPGGEDTAKMLRELHQRFTPNMVLLFKPSETGADNDQAGRLKSIAGFTGSLPAVGEGAAAYVCSGFSCERPVSSVAEMLKLLKSRR